MSEPATGGNVRPFWMTKGLFRCHGPAIVLTTGDSQMISVISLSQDSELKFPLVGSPDGDPGLDFTKG